MQQSLTTKILQSTISSSTINYNCCNGIRQAKFLSIVEELESEDITLPSSVSLFFNVKIAPDNQLLQEVYYFVKLLASYHINANFFYTII